MDLRALFAVEAAADAYLCQALRFLADGDAAAARRALLRVQMLRHNPLASSLLGIYREH